MTKVNKERESSLSHEELLSRVVYDGATGKFFDRKTGKSIGHYREDGYVSLCIRYRKLSAHRVAWFYHYGVWPKDQIDHINLNKQDNRICNLRECDHTGNQRNRVYKKKNKSGFRGVFLGRGYYRAMARDGKKQIYLGQRKTPEEAYELYKAFVNKEHREFQP